jgi:hypothetical protein
MVDITSLNGGRLLTAANIEEPFIGTIQRVEVEELRGDEGKTRKRAVIYLEGREKGIVVNQLRSEIVSKLARSKETDNWPGVKIGVRRGRTHFQGKAVDCVEICSPKTLNNIEEDESPY